MARDIEEFLRKAAERRAAQQKAAPAQAAPAQPAKSRPAQAQPIQRKPTPIRPLEPQRDYVAESVRPAQQQSVAEHVRQHIDTSDVSGHATQLGEEVGLADDKLADRLQKTFDHDVGSMVDSKQSKSQKRPAKKSAPPTSVATNVLNMLRSPKTIQQAILVSELLKRPDFDD